MNEVATLITVTASGEKFERKEKEVFCTRKSVRRQEFYAAMAAGQSPRHEFEVMAADYDAMKVKDRNSGKAYYPSELEYQGERMRIMRAYQGQGGTVSLTCG